MNLRSWIENVGAVGRAAPSFFQRRPARLDVGIFGQSMMPRLTFKEPCMSLSLSVRRLVLSLGWGLCLALPAAASAQTNYYARNGTEYPIVGSLPGDQVCPDAALTPNGGFVVWQDNATDGSGWGISAEQVNSTLSGSLSSFRV